MMDDARLFRRGDQDFPTTQAAQRRLIDAGRVEGEGPLAYSMPAGAGTRDAPACPASDAPSIASPRICESDGPSIPLGTAGHGMLHLDLNRLLAGRLLIQGSSGAGKSTALRHLVEECHDYLTVMIVDPEGEL